MGPSEYGAAQLAPALAGVPTLRVWCAIRPVPRSDAFRVCIVAASCGVPDVAASAAMRLAQIKPTSVRLPAGHEVFAQILSDAGLLEDSDT